MNCLFCKILSGELDVNIVAEDERVIAFLDAFPISDGHTLVIPKKHTCDLGTCNQEDLLAVFAMVQKVSRIIEASKLKPWGFNYLSNQGKVAGQEVLHFHVHIIPKYIQAEGFLFSAKKVNLLQLSEIARILAKNKKYNIIKKK